MTLFALLQAAPVAPDWSVLATSAISLLIPVAVYFSVVGVKKVVPLIPSWLIPVVAMALGYGASFVTSYITGHPENALLGIALGGLATVANEVVKALNDKGLTGTSTTVVAK
jgi:hypothetical protein